MEPPQPPLAMKRHKRVFDNLVKNAAKKRALETAKKMALDEWITVARYKHKQSDDLPAVENE